MVVFGLTMNHILFQGKMINHLPAEWYSLFGIIFVPEAIRLDILKKPIIELHISNIYKREEFRQKSLISDIVTGGIFGLGIDGYILAIISMQKLLKNENW